MKDLPNKIILFACCFAAYMLWPQWRENVTPVLAAVIITGFLSYFDRESVHAVLTVTAVVWSLFLPGLTAFLPMICYDLLFSRYQFLCLAALVPLFSLWRSAPLPAGAAITILLIISGCFKYWAVTLAKLKSDYNDMRDTTKEIAMQLKQQNRDLMEKQDYEINIATLNERNRIAREIHDNVGHLLSSSILQVGALLAVNKDEKIRENLLAVKDTLDEAMNTIRTSVHDLYDESVDLYAQVYELVKKFKFCKIEYDYDIKSDPDKRVKYAFISIVKESLSNMIKHSDATFASITFREHPALYQLIISDDGTVKNYDMEDGIGLKSITERIHSLNGNINITTNNGFQIFISVPKEGAIQ
nr:histidine kinase [uncultured Caproiciproducens sp.]